MKLLYIVCIILLSLMSIAASANPISTEINEPKARFNYQMFCQGCHTADGSGNKSVPTLKHSMNRFMVNQEGREYLVRVPGSANSVLNNKDLAEVLNWMLHTFSDQSKAVDWKPYEAEEVAEYRRHPLLETAQYRQRLLERISTK